MKRLMRLRKTPHLRNLSSETDFNVSQLIQPLFVVEGLKTAEDIIGLRETKRQPLDGLLRQIESDLEKGVKNFLLFNVPSQKKSAGFSHDFSTEVIEKIKKNFSDSLGLWVDTCLCSLTDTGHCGLFSNEKQGEFDSSATLNEISKAALSYASAGADGVSPSDMMDGRVGKIREILDRNGYEITPIMSYSTKFASQFYGPFRDAAQSSPKKGDRKAYQIDVRNRSDAIAASLRCAEEGADLLMVKPGMTSIDLIRPIAELAKKPVGAYQVSAEYASLNFLAEKKLLNYEAALFETWSVFKRAGAQFIITYGARDGQKILKERS